MQIAGNINSFKSCRGIRNSSYCTTKFQNPVRIIQQYVVSLFTYQKKNWHGTWKVRLSKVRAHEASLRIGTPPILSYFQDSYVSFWGSVFKKNHSTILRDSGLFVSFQHFVADGINSTLDSDVFFGGGRRNVKWLIGDGSHELFCEVSFWNVKWTCEGFW